MTTVHVRTNYNDDGAIPVPTKITAADMNGISAQLNTNTDDIASMQALRPRRSTIAAMGTSITALGSYGWSQPWLGHCYLNQLQLLTHQRIRYGAGNFAVSGTVLAQMQSDQLPQVLAMNPPPGACVVEGPTNDLQSVSYNFPAAVNMFKQIIAALVKAGIPPILWCPPPNDYVGPVATATIHARTYQWNTWIRRFADEIGYPLINAHAALAQLDGTLKAGVSGDGIHPNGYGHRLIAEQAIADGLADWFPVNSLVHTARNTDDLTNMFNNGTINEGLHTVDTNADGVANGLSSGGTGTRSYAVVAPVATDQLAGSWQQSTAAASATSNVTRSFSTGWSVGDTIAFSARVQASGIEASGGGWWLVALKTDIPGGYTAPDGTTGLTYLWDGTYQWDCDMADGELYVEFTIPTGATTLQLWESLGGATTAPITLRVGELTVRNLTTGGLLV